MDPEENINKEREEGQASVKLRNYRRLTKIQGLRPSVIQVMKLMKVTWYKVSNTKESLQSDIMFYFERNP